MQCWFTSDYHMGHFNIIRYCNRPFKSLYHMNETIIKHHNERVKPEDLVYHIGDFCFKNSPKAIHRGEGDIVNATGYEKRLNGKIIFIKGSHDNNNSCKTNIERIVIKLGGKRLNLVHDPVHADLNYEINLIGHVHTAYKFKRIPTKLNKQGYVDLINVGVDVNNFYPVEFSEIMRDYSSWVKQGVKNGN